jgi:cell division protease FtsH
LQEKALKGDKNAQQQIDAIDVVFFGKTSQKSFARIADGVPVEVQYLVGMITDAARYAKFGLTCPNGILFTGLPGTGKTLLAKSLAEEIGCEFIEAKGSEFIQMYIGVGAQRIRDLFIEARTRAKNNRFGKTIIFIDELDAIGSRSAFGAGPETKRTVTELLTQMDGFAKDDSVIVIAATNIPR